MVGKQSLYPQGHNARGVTKLLWEFTCDCYPSEKTNVKEILRFDVFVSQPNWLPSWMGWKTAELNERAMAFWRDKDEVRQYLPDYIFSTWRQIRKNYLLKRLTIMCILELRKEWFLWRITATVNVR